jgi:hypothetical protein
MWRKDVAVCPLTHIADDGMVNSCSPLHQPRVSARSGCLLGPQDFNAAGNVSAMQSTEDVERSLGVGHSTDGLDVRMLLTAR